MFVSNKGISCCFNYTTEEDINNKDIPYSDYFLLWDAASGDPVSGTVAAVDFHIVI